MKKAAYLALFLAFCLLLTACGAKTEAEPSPSPSPSAAPSPSPTPAPAKAPEFALAYDPQGTWDPYQGSGNANMALCGLVYEGFYRLDRTFAPHTALAEEASPSPDGLTWTVKLREGVTFSDGTPLTAEAAGRAVNRARGAGSAYSARLSGIERVLWDDEVTLRLVLKAPNADLTALLDFPIALVTEEGVYGTGPYTVADGALEAREDWWRGEELPRTRIALTPAAGEDELISAFDGGRVSVAATDPTGPNALGYAGNYQTWMYPTSNLIYIGFRASGGPCEDKELRVAVSQAVDRGKLVGEVLGGHASVASYPAHPESKRYSKTAAARLAYDPAKAAEGLEALGYQPGEDGLRYKARNPLTLVLLVNSDNSFKVRMAHSIREDLEALGVTVTVKALGWEEYIKALERGSFDLYLGECRLTGDMDLTPFLTKDSGLAYGEFESEELTAALEDGRRTGRWLYFDRLWAEEVPVAALCFKTGTVLTGWGRCEGLSPTQASIFDGIEGWTISGT